MNCLKQRYLFALIVVLAIGLFGRISQAQDYSLVINHGRLIDAVSARGRAPDGLRYGGCRRCGPY